MGDGGSGRMRVLAREQWRGDHEQTMVGREGDATEDGSDQVRACKPFHFFWDGGDGNCGLETAFARPEIKLSIFMRRPRKHIMSCIVVFKVLT